MTVHLLPGGAVVENVSLDDLIDLQEAGFQDWSLALRETESEHVAQLVASGSEQWPPLETVKVQLNGRVYHAVIDGYHRWGAGMELELDRLDVIARTYADEDAVIEAAFQANLRHGLASNKKTRSEYAVWLYFRECDLHADEPDYKPVIADIARRVGLERSAASRAISRALKETEEQGAPMTPEARAEADSVTKLVHALHTFYKSEHALLSNGNGERDAKYRAKLLYNHVGRLPQEQQARARAELAALGSALGVWVSMYSVKTGAWAGKK